MCNENQWSTSGKFFFYSLIMRHVTIFLNTIFFFSLSFFVYNLKLSEVQPPQSWMSVVELMSGLAANKLGMAALKECPVIEFLLSVKSLNSVASQEFSFAFVRNLPDLKAKIGLFLHQIPSDSAILFNLYREAEGQILFPSMG